jgi:hypothetical protein
MDERMYQESLRKIVSLQQQLENQELSDMTLKSLGELVSGMWNVFSVIANGLFYSDDSR